MWIAQSQESCVLTNDDFESANFAAVFDRAHLAAHAYFSVADSKQASRLIDRGGVGDSLFLPLGTENKNKVMDFRRCQWSSTQKGGRMKVYRSYRCIIQRTVTTHQWGGS